MKINNLSFRDLDRHWIAFHRKKDIKKICKLLKTKMLEPIILGYVYIDHINGIQIRVVGNVIHENGTYSLDEETIHKNWVLSYSKDMPFDITILEKGITQNIHSIDQVENQYKHLYLKKALLESRKIECIDEFRHEEYIDDLEVSLKTHKKEEFLWARIEDCSPNDLVFVCALLDSSKKQKQYKENCLVLVKLINDQNTIKLVIDSIVNKVPKQKEKTLDI